MADSLDSLRSSYKRDSNDYASWWQSQADKYKEAQKYYSGRVLEETEPKGVKGAPDKFPLRINKVKQACVMHANYLWGEHQPDSLIEYTVTPKSEKTNKARERATDIKNFLEEVLAASAAPTLFREQARLYMEHGGIYFKARPDKTNPTGIAIESASPDVIYPVWNPLNYRQLLRLHVVLQINAKVAEQLYGYNPDMAKKAWGSGTDIEYVESWSPDGYVVTVGGQQAVDMATGQPMRAQLNWINPLTGQKIMPWVYIPRLRTGAFYGDSLAHELMGLQDELNIRKADLGDATTLAAHPGGWGRDLGNRAEDNLQMNAGKIMDMGESSPNGEPYVAALPTPNLSQGLTEFADKLAEDLHDMAQLSPVMFGKDEGSQRSALTLAMRAIPTTSMINDYRADWGEGLKDLAHIILAIAHDQKLGNIGKDHFGHKLSVTFGPVLPKDREALVTECVTLYSAGLRSRRRCIEMLPEVPDVEKELEELEKEEKAKQEREMEAQKMQSDAAMEQAKLKNDTAVKVAETRASKPPARGE
jgi:hypothetical protein